MSISPKRLAAPCPPTNRSRTEFGPSPTSKHGVAQTCLGLAVLPRQGLRGRFGTARAQVWRWPQFPFGRVDDAWEVQLKLWAQDPLLVECFATSRRSKKKRGLVGRWTKRAVQLGPVERRLRFLTGRVGPRRRYTPMSPPVSLRYGCTRATHGHPARNV